VRRIQSCVYRLFFLVFAVCTCVASVSLAQTSKGSISGTVTDHSGAVVTGAQVKAMNDSLGGEQRIVTTDGEGKYLILTLDPGVYTLEISGTGFSSLKIDRVEVKGSVISTVNAVLEIGKITDTILVEASAGQELQTTSGELSNTISRKEVGELPILGLNAISLVLTEPGVIQPSSREDFTNGVGFSVNGTRPRGNNFLLDGQSNNDLSITGQAFQPQNQEAIGEVTILTNSYGSEYGKGGGSVTNVIYRSGTNNFHGSAWDLIQNTALQAIDASDKAPIGNTIVCKDKSVPQPNGETCKPVSVENTFGFAGGGRIVRDKLFFFGTSQWDRTRSTATDSTLRVPTEAGFQTLSALPSNPRVDALLLGLGTLRAPTATSNIALGNGRPSVEVGNAQPSGIAQLSNARESIGRVDWIPTTNNSFSVRYIDSTQIFTPDTFANPGQLPGFRTQQGGPSRNLSTNWTRTINPKTVNEFRFAFSDIDFSFGLTPETAANPQANGATLLIAGLLSGTGVGVNSAFPQGRSNKTYQFQDAFTRTGGRHTWKFGFDVGVYKAEQAVPFNSRGTINYNAGGDCGGAACTGLANFIDDFSGSSGVVAKVFGSPIVHPDQNIQGYYAEDAWQVRANFTLTLGVRYEFFGTPENVLPFPAVRPELGQFTDPFPTAIKQKDDRNNWAPRVSFAYTPKIWQGLFGRDKTVLRAGYGMFYDGIFNNILVNSAASAPNVVGGSITSSDPGRGTADFSTTIGDITPGTLSPFTGVTSIASNLVSPLTHQWNVNVERELPGKFVVTAAYVGTRGERLFGNDEYNYRVDGVRINPDRGSVLVRTNGRDSIYHGGQFKLDRRFSRGLLLRASYTYSKLIDNGSEVFTTSGGSSRVQDFANIGADRGLSAFDRRHRAVFTYVYDIPSWKPDHGAGIVLSQLIRDWQVSGTVAFQAGAPETIFVGGSDTNNDGNAFNGRPNIGNLAAAPTSIGIDGTLFGVPTPAGSLYEVQNFLQCDDVTIPCLPAQPDSNFHYWVQPGVGNVGRNTVITEGRQDWTFGLLRRIKMPVSHLEGQELEFRTEFFNPFNHPNRGIYSLDVFDPLFADKDQTRAGGRQIRFWLKYRF